MNSYTPPCCVVSLAAARSDSLPFGEWRSHRTRWQFAESRET